MKKIYFLAVIMIAMFVVVQVLFLSGDVQADKGDATVYRTAKCGCCKIHAKYLRKNGFNVSEFELTDYELANKREELGVPSQYMSCHTTVVKDYFIEGHVPFEAIEYLLKEKSAVKGIALPGMPVGSPGMPGRKQEAFSIYGVDLDGNVKTYITL